MAIPADRSSDGRLRAARRGGRGASPPHDPGRARDAADAGPASRLMAHGTMEQIRRPRRGGAQALAARPRPSSSRGCCTPEALVSLGEHAPSPARSCGRTPPRSRRWIPPVRARRSSASAAPLPHLDGGLPGRRAGGWAGMIDTRGGPAGAIGALGFPLAVPRDAPHAARGVGGGRRRRRTRRWGWGEDSVGTFVFSLGLAAVAMIAAHRGAVDPLRGGGGADARDRRGGWSWCPRWRAPRGGAGACLWLAWAIPPAPRPHLERTGGARPAAGHPRSLVPVLGGRSRGGPAYGSIRAADAVAAWARSWRRERARTGGAWAAAAAARVRGALTAPDGELDALLADALAAPTTGRRMPFEPGPHAAVLRASGCDGPGGRTDARALLGRGARDVRHARRASASRSGGGARAWRRNGAGRRPRPPGPQLPRRGRGPSPPARSARCASWSPAGATNREGGRAPVPQRPHRRAPPAPRAIASSACAPRTELAPALGRLAARPPPRSSRNRSI